MTRFFSILLLLMLVPCACAAPAEIPARWNTWDNCEFVNDGWLYLEKDIPKPPAGNDEYAKVSLPHCWNAKDAQRTKAYRRAGGWYRKKFHCPIPKDHAGAPRPRYFLRFGAAGQMAKVYANGKLLTTHIGGYSAFTVELPTAWQVVVDVYVSNAYNADIAPLSADFTFYGGLYRGVQLLSTGPTCISRTRAGGPGVELTTTYDPKTGQAALAGKATLSGIPRADHQLKLIVSVAGQKKLFPLVGDTASFKLDLGKIKPWSPDSPTLYPVTVTLWDENPKAENHHLDAVYQRVGFRSFRFDAKKGFYLNGKHLFLKGVNRHQDRDQKGNALADADHHQDIALMKELGVNWLRLAHYQQDDYMLQLCDEMGLLVWEEVPFVNKMTLGKAFEGNLISMITDMVTQHRNHISVILWGIGNEYILGQKAHGAEKVAMMKRMEERCKTLDPSRNTVSAGAYTSGYSKGGFVQITDVIGYNLYPGWYGGQPPQIAAAIKNFHRMNPNKPFILSEWGAGCDQRLHSETPRRQDFTEEWQCYYIEEYLNAFETLPFLAGVNYWNYADFGSANRGNSIPHVNQKGLVNFRREKKDSFYLVKSRWSNEPVVHIAGQDWKHRWGDAKKTYRVYSNCDSVELSSNGVSLGKQSKTRKHEFTVTLAVGKNTLVATAWKNGKTFTNTLVVSYSLEDPNPPAIIATATKAKDDPRYAVDGDPVTRFSYQGKGCLTLDLREVKALVGLTVRLYKGTERDYPYRVEVSADKKKWTTIAEGTSKKTGTLKLKFDAADVQYIRIHGEGQVGNKHAFVAYEEVTPIYSKAGKSIYETVGPKKKPAKK